MAEDRAFIDPPVDTGFDRCITCGCWRCECDTQVLTNEQIRRIKAEFGFVTPEGVTQTQKGE